MRNKLENENILLMINNKIKKGIKLTPLELEIQKRILLVSMANISKLLKKWQLNEK